MYPLGISSECWLVYCALEPAAESMPAYNMALKAVLLIYVPGKQPSLGQRNVILITFRELYIVYAHDVSETANHEGKRKELIKHI